VDLEQVARVAVACQQGNWPSGVTRVPDDQCHGLVAGLRRVFGLQLLWWLTVDLDDGAAINAHGGGSGGPGGDCAHAVITGGIQP
jgi:hypothetical protein